MEQVLIYLDNLPFFLLYFACAALIGVLFIAIYMRVTPHREIELIRAGNTAAALNLGGAFIGFAIPEASVIVSSLDLLDMFLWGVVAMVVQLVTYQLLRLVVPDLSGAIVADRVSVGLFAGAVSVGIGVLNAACLTY